MSQTEISVIPLDFTYTREHGLWLMDVQSLPLPEWFTVAKQSLIGIPAKSFGGDHIHPRAEIFIAMGALDFIWKDKEGNIQRIPMNPSGKLQLTIVPPMIPHVVVNTDASHMSYLYELANEAQHDVERAHLLEQITI